MVTPREKKLLGAVCTMLDVCNELVQGMEQQQPQPETTEKQHLKALMFDLLVKYELSVGLTKNCDYYWIYNTNKNQYVTYSGETQVFITIDDPRIKFETLDQVYTALLAYGEQQKKGRNND